MLGRRVMTRLTVILLLTLLLAQLASAKRSGPGKVDPVIYEGIRYVALNDVGRGGHRHSARYNGYPRKLQGPPSLVRDAWHKPIGAGAASTKV